MGPVGRKVDLPGAFPGFKIWQVSVSKEQ